MATNVIVFCIASLFPLSYHLPLNYERLVGDKAGRSSIRVNDKYRIEFTVRQTQEEPIITICNILELSNHYK